MEVGEDLLLSDNESEDKKREERPYINKRLNNKINSSYAKVDLEKNKKQSENENDKILVASKILINETEQKPKPISNTSEQNNNLLSFVLNPNAVSIPVKSEQNNQPIYQGNINNNTNLNNNNLNNNINVQYVQSPPSSFLNQSLDKGSNKLKAEKRISMNSSSLLQPPIQQNNEPIIFDERKEYENKINEYKTQKENIKKAYPIEMERKEKEYKMIEKNLKEEIENLEKRYKNELIDQENLWNEKINRYNKELSEIEEERIKKLRKIREYYDSLYKQTIEKLENQYNIDKENIESNQKYDLERLDIELENIKESNRVIVPDKISSIRVDDLYGELYKKINSENNDIEYKIQLKKNELIQKELEIECNDLSEETNRLKDSLENFEKKILEKKLETEEILNKIENEKKDLLKKEYDIKDKEIKMKYYYDENIMNLDNEINNMENKFNEEKNLYELNNEELTKEENKLKQKQELFEIRKKNVLQNIENNKYQINDEIKELKKYEEQIDNNLNNLKINEMEIIKNLNQIKDLNEDNLSEKENIEKQKYNHEMIERRIYENINLLNKEKEEIEKEKERIKKQKIEIEIENKKLDEAYNMIEQENKMLDLKNQTINNMRMDYILNNKYENNDIGLKTMPTFKYNGYNNPNININKDIKPKYNFAQTFSAFNTGNNGGKFNADDYFAKLNKEINDKKDISNNGYDFDKYLINGRNFIKDTREQLKQLDNK